MPKPAKKPPAPSTIEPQNPEEQILPRERTVRKRGREDGHELEDWFRAKEEITIKKFRTATA